MRTPRARFLRVTLATFLVLASAAAHPSAGSSLLKLDSLLLQRLLTPGRSRVVLRATGGQALSTVLPLVQLLGGRIVRPLPLIDGLALDVPNLSLVTLAAHSGVLTLSVDREVAAAMARTSGTVGAPAVRSRLGLDGSGIGVAIIDSGITPWHDDLGSPAGGQRVDRFVDFVAGRAAPLDELGHGTHVAGIIAGNGLDAGGAQAGIAPAARLTILRVLDAQGHGRISDVIAALDYAVSNKDVLGIRVINLSVAAGVYESYLTDPLTLAARRAVDAGLVVVAAAGNNGRGPDGHTRYGGITAPGNAPWVLTVGASSHLGTVDRSDDAIAAFSSRGPSAIDANAKPDLVAPGVGIESLSDASSALYAAHPSALLDGTVPLAYHPYMSLSGTSMSAPVVTGTVALMLQANPSLTPSAVKAILQFTAQTYGGYDPLTEGAGFLNADGAVALAAWYVSPWTTPYPNASAWSGHVIWGNRMVDGPAALDQIVSWPVGAPWGNPLLPLLPPGENVVWGTMCGGYDCAAPWNARAVTTTNDPESDTVVWGTSDGEGDTVVWGTSCADPSCETVVWDRP